MQMKAMSDSFRTVHASTYDEYFDQKIFPVTSKIQK